MENFGDTFSMDQLVHGKVAYLHGNGPNTLNSQNISTVNLPVPENDTRASHRSHQIQPMESSSTAGLPSYRSRSNVHVSFYLF